MTLKRETFAAGARDAGSALPRGSSASPLNSMKTALLMAERGEDIDEYVMPEHLHRYRIYAAVTFCYVAVFIGLALSFGPLGLYWRPVVTTTMTTTTVFNASALAESDAAVISGVTWNSAKDLEVFLNGLTLNIVLCFICAMIFVSGVRKTPRMFKNNSLPESSGDEDGSPLVPKDPGITLRSCIAASLTTTTSEATQWIGLDNAMLIEFTDLCLRIMFKIYVPMLGIMGPLNLCFGSTRTLREHGRHVAGEDYLSYFSFGNVEKHSWLYYVHACVMWYVVVVVSQEVIEAQTNFLERRYKWLGCLPELRANTILVEGIPDEFRSDEKLYDFFTEMFPPVIATPQGIPSRVTKAYVCKSTGKLLGLISKKDKLTEQRKTALVKQENGGWGSGPKLLAQIENLKEQEAKTESDINDERERILADKHIVGSEGHNCHCGFVTFHFRRDAEVALRLDYNADSAEFTCSVPPVPSDILWPDLIQAPGIRTITNILGFLGVLLLYVTYLPSVIWITNIGNAITLPWPFTSLWASIAPTLGLQIMVSFLPTFLIIVFRSFFTLKADAVAQHMLQESYFMFQVVFVILTTAIGKSVVGFTDQIVEHPRAVFHIMAETMPRATHFYMNFVVLRWTTHAWNLTRRANVGKYLARRATARETEEESRAAAEPEDQDYYGIGSRISRMTIDMLVGIIYSTLSPPIALLVFLDFALCRVVYGFLVPFAETKKPDLGGVFWVTALEQLFGGLVIYVVVMVGVIGARTDSWGPMVIAGSCLPFVLYRWERVNEYHWRHLPFSAVLEFEKQWNKGMASAAKRDLDGLSLSGYVQPELETEGPEFAKGRSIRSRNQSTPTAQMLSSTPLTFSRSDVPSGALAQAPPSRPSAFTPAISSGSASLPPASSAAGGNQPQSFLAASRQTSFTPAISAGSGSFTPALSVGRNSNPVSRQSSFTPASAAGSHTFSRQRGGNEEARINSVSRQSSFTPSVTPSQSSFTRRTTIGTN